MPKSSRGREHTHVTVADGQERPVSTEDETYTMRPLLESSFSMPISTPRQFRRLGQSTSIAAGQRH